jgi:hypothetical protein
MSVTVDVSVKKGNQAHGQSKPYSKMNIVVLSVPPSGRCLAVWGFIIFHRSPGSSDVSHLLSSPVQYFRRF